MGTTFRKDLWDFKVVIDYTTASGSLVKMFDDSTKQIQDIEVGDVVKSYKPVGMPDEMFADDWLNYSTTDLTVFNTFVFSSDEKIK